MGGLPKRMRLKLIEPLRELFKDEVRVVGKELGLPDHVVHRQPFPGPGLAIRIIGDVTRERVAHAPGSRSHRPGRNRKKDGLQTYMAVLCHPHPDQDGGVMGDERTYANVIALRIVESRRRHDRGLGADPL